MHISNLPLIATSLCFLLPSFAGVETGNLESAAAWGVLLVTSTLVHTTKQPFHLHGPGNCIPWLYTMDVIALYVATARAVYDSWHAGTISSWMAAITVLYANVMFYGGHATGRFVYDAHVEHSILSHATTHLLAAWGGTCSIYARAFKNGQSSSHS